MENPVLLFDFTDGGIALDFDDALSLSIRDQSPAGSVSIAAGNVVTLSGSHVNTANDGFALQLAGSFTTFTFQTNTNLAAAQSFGFSIAQGVPIPEPSRLVLGMVAVSGIIAAVRGKPRRTKPDGVLS